MPNTGTLTKSDIVSAVAAANDFPRSKAAKTIEIVLELIKKALESGDDVLISGFGKFCVKHKRERRGRNPITGEDMLVRARRVITFRLSGKLREKINQF
jgi:integration host factor subunit alpha